MARGDWTELTAREGVILAAVGRRLTNTEIAEDLHISVRTVESHIAALRRKLRVESRSEMITAARDRRREAVQLPQNSFVGRDDHIDNVRELLDRERWVTVVGAPGSGKTRFALEYAQADNRVPVVAELEHAASDEVVGVVATAIGLEAGSSTGLVATCGVALSAEPYLLVIDNCDRVTDAVGNLIEELLVLAPSLIVLATSRSPIGRSGETIFQLPPLLVEDDPKVGAVRLFFDRASAAAPAEKLSEESEEAVMRICRRLDGLPLAIELAAARVRHLPMAELDKRLADGFGALDRTGSTGRHRTLEAAFDWTWDLLDDDEKSVLSRLAALPGSFDLDLAEAVTMTGADRVVLRLLDRSLLSHAARSKDRMRFRLLDSLRAFVLQRSSAGVVQEVREAHAHYHAALAADLAGRARTDDSPGAIEGAKQLYPDVNAAIDWTISQHHEMALSLTRALAVLVVQYNSPRDSRETIARAARDPYVREIATARDLFAIGSALTFGDLELVVELASLALSIADDEPSQFAAHSLAGMADAYSHRGSSALRHLSTAERLATKSNDLRKLACVSQFKGVAFREQVPADPEAALAAYEEALRGYSQAGDPIRVNNVRYMMAVTAAEAGIHKDRAILWAQQCAEYAHERGERHEFAHAMLALSLLSPPREEDGDLLAAVETFRAVGDLRCLTRSYLLLAGRCAAPDQIPLLEQALEVARKAHDIARQSTSLERLIHALWESGAHRAAVVSLGELTSLIGHEAAIGRCPEAIVQELDHWETAIAEGRARRPSGVEMV